jgi:indole-3-glycerol phosphate synthase
MSVVEPKFCFVEVHGKDMLCHAMELSQVMLGIDQEGLTPLTCFEPLTNLLLP